MNKELLNQCYGEAIGTFILVFFGCGSVGCTLFFNAFSSLFEVAFIWGLAVTLGIYTSRNLCPSHLNPAVTMAMVIAGKANKKTLLPFWLFQFLGAFVAGGLLYWLFSTSINLFELNNGIVRGTPSSQLSASMFGEFFPNPGFQDKIKINWIQAMGAEALGTFLLVFAIFKITEKESKITNFTPFIIGMTVTAIICIIAPFTQAGLNPARDLGPRLIAYIAGWGKAAFPTTAYSFLTVYVIGPFIGAGIATFLNKVTATNPKEDK